MSWAKCSECAETFTGDKWFDRHRMRMSGQPGFDPEYDWRCRTPEEMRALGWVQTDKGWWQGDPGRANPFARSAAGAA